MSRAAELPRNLPQTFRAIKHIACRFGLTVAPALMASSALACDSQAEALFSCGIGENADQGSIILCRIEGENPDEYVGVQFGLDAGETQVVYPADPHDSFEKFAFSNTDGPDGYLVDVRFADGDTAYRLYSLNIPPDPAVSDDVGGGAAGVVITAPDGTQRRVACGERPSMFISYMRGVMQCDTGNPLGTAACDPDHVPERRAPLGEEAGAPLVVD